MREKIMYHHGVKRHGNAIDFGDNDLEMWYLFYCDNKITRLLICKEPRPSLDTLIDSFDDRRS